MNKEKINYKVIEFSLDKAKVEGNKVVLRCDHSFEPEWYYFKTSKTKFPIGYVDNEGNNRHNDINGLYYLEHKSSMDLVILEPIIEVKVNAVIEFITNKGMKFKILKENDCIDSMTNLYEITYINGVINKIEKV